MTTLPPVTVADVIRRFGPEYAATRPVTLAQQRVMEALVACRTADLGGHVLRCTACRERTIAYNSCRNRHCPSCLNHKSREWLEARAADLLPVEYYHVVFTLPDEVAALALGNKKVVYDILFAASAETLQTIARDPKHLGAHVGFLSVLHTWDQRLRHHPHVHCIVPGGGLNPEGDRWVSCRKGFFLPVRVLSRLYRGKFLAKLHEAYEEGELQFAGATAGYASPEGFRAFIRHCRKKEWVVYAKRPFGSPTQVLKYLARYTHRVAISNTRIVAIEGQDVLFRYRISAEQNTYGTMRVRGTDFVRRFLQHVLPKGYTRIRSYGFLANRYKKERLALCRSLLEPASTPVQAEPSSTDEDRQSPEADDPRRCPSCGKRSLRRIREVDPLVTPTWRLRGAPAWHLATLGSP